MGQHSIVIVCGHVAPGPLQPVNTEVFAFDITRRDAVHGRTGHAEFRQLAIAASQP